MTQKTALITGASRGLGRALARELAREGWNLIVDARTPRALDDAAAELAAVAGATGAGTRLVAIAGDVGDAAHRAALGAAVREAGGLDLLVNNAGTLGTTPLPRLADQPVRDLADAFATNVLAPLALIQRLLPALRERRGGILNITSDAAVEGYATWGGYGATKAALEQLSNVLAAEEPDLAVWWADPGEMGTAMLRAAGEDADPAPPPEVAAAALRHLVAGGFPSGRYRTVDLGEPAPAGPR